jgi:hypothetical protein
VNIYKISKAYSLDSAIKTVNGQYARSISTVKKARMDDMLAYWIGPSGEEIIAENGHEQKIPYLKEKHGAFGDTIEEIFLDNFIRISIFNKVIMIHGKSIKTINNSQKDTILKLANGKDVIVLDFKDYYGRTLKDKYELDDALSGKPCKKYANNKSFIIFKTNL